VIAARSGVGLRKTGHSSRQRHVTVKDRPWHPIEKHAGPPDIDPVDPQPVDERRRSVYQSYELFFRQRLEEQNNLRPRQWDRDYSSLDAYERSVSPMRDRLKQMLGFWAEPEKRFPVNFYNEETIHQTEDFTARRFDLEILPGVATYAVELVPAVTGCRPGLLLQHGYGGTPELICGLTQSANREDYSYRSLGIRAVKRGYHVVAMHHPYGHGALDDEWFGLPRFEKMPGEYAKNRLHRLATLAGGTLFGLDLMASSRGIDLLQNFSDVDHDKIGMYGLSQGGQTALFLPALDTRIKASVSSAYFNCRLNKLIGPCESLSYLDSNEEDKFFSEVVSVFSDADVVSLVAPRAFAVEAGLHDSAVDFEKVCSEFELAQTHFDKLNIGDHIEFIPHREGHVSATERAFEFLEKGLSHGCLSRQ